MITKVDIKKTSPHDDLFNTPPGDVVKKFFSSKPKFYSMGMPVWDPPTDIYETREMLVIKMELAGVSLDNIEVLLEDNQLVVSGCRQEGDSSGKEHYHLMEIHYGKFKRVFVLPRNIARGKISASFDRGFLKILIPRKTESDSIQVKIE
jgi:HSP20 family molecular chaperone IbpA